MCLSRPILLIFALLSMTGCSMLGLDSSGRRYYRDIPKSQKIYVVKRGDTLYGIGKRSGHGYKRLAGWNRLFYPYSLAIGQKIKLYKPKQKVSLKKGKNARSSSSKKTRAQSQKSSMLSNDNKKMLKFYCGWPLKGTILKSFKQTGKKGIDISGKPGQFVRAAAAGKVVYSGHGLIGYGNLIIIKHNHVYLSAYGNNKKSLVKEGQKVKKGQAIAKVGRLRGKQTSLHFEIRKNGKPVNPLWYLPKR